MVIDVITLFPEMFVALDYSIVGRAKKEGKFELKIHQLRDYATDKHRMTDDRPFGGGPGMVLKPEPLFNAVESIKKLRSGLKSLVVLMTPQGQVLRQSKVVQLARQPEHLIIICGRYEGVDQRVRDHLVDEEISIGDYVLTGGELPAMVLIDAVVRLLPGVLGSQQSAQEESFSHFLLDHPQYTQPAEFRGWSVPEVLRSGHHGQIAAWRQQQAEKLTRQRRPDLWQKYLASKSSQDDSKT